MRARKEYECAVCKTTIHKGDEYTWIADIDDIIETRSGRKPRPGASFDRLHEKCASMVCDGGECVSDYDEAVTFALAGAGYAVQNYDWMQALKTQNPVIEDNEVKDFVKFMRSVIGVTA